MSDHIVKRDAPETDRIEGESDLDIGQWYWIKRTKDVRNPDYVPKEDEEVSDYEYDDDDDWDADDEEEEDAEEENSNPEWLKVKYERIACIVYVGTNYAELEWPTPQHHQSTTRIHFDNWTASTRREYDPESVVGERIHHFQDIVQTKMERVKQITAGLGVSSRMGIAQAPQEEGTTALVTLSGTEDPKEYENALVKAKDVQLPKLFEEIKSANASLAIWMNASVIPLEAQIGRMDEVVSVIKGRIFNVTLYAGLSEKVTQFADGDPADISAKLHIMQRKCFMDEECLANYRTGGMEFGNIEEFDLWMSEPENRDRLLPFPRTMVSFQVRRNDKDRGEDGTLSTRMININLEDLDKATFLYFRNGEQLYRMNCDLEFGLKIFPNRDSFDPSGPLMFKMSPGRKVDEVITLREFESLCTKNKELEAEHKKQVVIRKEWIKKNLPKKWWYKTHWDLQGKTYTAWFAIMKCAPYGGYSPTSLRLSIDPDEWEPFDSGSVYYDEVVQEMTDQVQYYNRVAMIVQGLYDRSTIFHPHPPVKLWTGEGFQDAVELVYDGSNVIYAADKPDFNAYRDACNRSLSKGSIVVGQEKFWEKKEAVKECARRDRSWRHDKSPRPDRFRPYYDDGPGYLAEIERWQKKSSQAVFKWTHDRQKLDRWVHQSRNIQKTLTVPISSLFNVSAYKPGDFKQFFADPRTRAEYFHWAPMLLEAEEYHAGNVKAQKPGIVGEE